MAVIYSTLDDAKKYLDEAEKLKNEIFSTKTDVKIKGKTYYVSADGDDSNDGLSPERAWKSMDKLNHVTFEYGDGVLFRRGDRFKATLVENAWSSIKTQSGVTYSTYGEGPKPILDSTIDASGADKWVKTEWENVWEYTEKVSGRDADIGIIIFDDGNAWGIKVSTNPQKQTRIFIGKTFNGIDKNDAPEEAWILPYNVKRELEFHHNWENDTLYVYSAKGNPGERFEKIELVPRRHCFWGDVHDVLIDNLDIYGAGGHGFSTAHCDNLTVQNCLFRWIGGSIQGRSYRTDGLDPIRFGNSVENWSEGKNFTIHHCFSTQIYDCCWTIQWCGKSNEGDMIFENVEFHHNYTEYANNGLEVWNGPAESNDPELHFEIRNMHLHDNYTLYSGYGWSHQRPNKDANFFYGGLPKKTRLKFFDSHICNNVNLFTTAYVTWASQIGPDQFNFHDNIYFMTGDKRFGLVPIDRVSCEGEQEFVPYTEEALNKLQKDGIEKGSIFHILPAGSVPTSFD
ncbi:MAG: hypothetical protein IJ391_08525 [Clostridia bacterium]|nr:hypothetical protein [Clostridia bacterium]